ncbi:MAG: sulfatase-like hydrolase/transferase [Proteobacteria bacterium]|nr:sulfatase-like hydrolase/transferase [Pseudomonadota bacterium]MCP4915625.1 sulfatase-like hydrolase/transferase [Pseudomonadota bacterium]
MILGWLACSTPEPAPVVVEAPAPVVEVHSAAERTTVVVIVMDTVRASSTSVCGHDRPTTPTLEALVADGASLSCRAYAPSSWTLPSHAAFFTGQSVAELGVGTAPGGLVEGKDRLVPLPDEATTLAERFGERGYQTVLVSGNSLLGTSGLNQGFDVERISGTTKREPVLIDEDFRQAFDGAVDELDPQAPLFLVVNLLEAHDPWREVPEGVEWLPAQKGMFGMIRWFKKFSRGELSEADRAAFLTRAIDLYDYAIHRSDRNVGHVLERLRERGWDRAGLRVLVTSDHGEYLGEHGLIRHRHALGEPATRVPFLWWASDGSQVALPEPMSARLVHDLALDGVLPDELPSVEASVWPDPHWQDWSNGAVGTHAEAAVWLDDDKLRWAAEGESAYDLATDPGELTPTSADGRSGQGELQRVVTEMTTAVRVGVGGVGSALEAMGYVDPE